MKKFSLIFLLSFISYPLGFIAAPYITAQTWADIISFLFIGANVYQFLYIVYLRKKDNVSFGRSIANYFLYALGSFVLWEIYVYFDMFFNGYTECAFLGECYETYYGFEAWKHNEFDNIVYGMLSLICFIYFISYYLISKKKKKSNK